MNRGLVTVVLILAMTRPIPGVGVARGQEGVARRHRVWAVVIGIDRYEDPAIPRRPGAIRDGGDVARWLVETARWDRRQILLMNENGSERAGKPEDPITNLRPTSENLEWALRRWVDHRAGEGDVVVLYFAGRVGLAPAGEVLLPIDASADDPGRRGWSPEGAIDHLVLRKKCAVVCWLDTPPFLSTGPGAATEARDGQAEVRLLDRLARWPGVTAWLAIDGGPALGTNQNPQSPIVAGLLKGLGTRPANLLACLDRMRHDPALSARGFRTRGSVGSGLSLWPEFLLPTAELEPRLLLQQGHADAVTAVAVSADGERWISAGKDSTIRIWRARDRLLLRVLSYHTIGVTALALGLDGRLLASGDGAGRVRVWDLAEHRPRVLDGPSPHNAPVLSLGFLRDGTRFVSLDQDARCVLWETSGPTLRARPLIEGEARCPVVALGDGPVALAVIGADDRVHLFGDDGSPRGTLEGPGGPPSALDFSPDGRRMAVGGANGSVLIREVPSVPSSPGMITHPRSAWSGSGPPALAVSEGGRMHRAAVDRDGPGLTLDGLADDVEAAIFSPDGRWLAALDGAGGPHLWDLSRGDRPEPIPLAFEAGMRGLSGLAFAPDGRGLLAGQGDGALRFWDLPDRRERPAIPPHRGKIDVLSLSTDGVTLLQITHDGIALLWDLKEGRGARALDGRWTSGAFLPDGLRLAMTRDANDGGDVVLVDRKSGRARPEVVFDRPATADGRGTVRLPFGMVAVSEDGRRVAAAAAPGRGEFACVWDVGGGAPRVLRGHTKPLAAIRFSPDGRALLTVGEEGEARLWDLQDQKAPAIEFQIGQGLEVTAVQFLGPDPRRLVAACWAPGRPGQVVLCEFEPGRGVGVRSSPLGEFGGRVHAVTCSPDGRWVAAAGQDRAVRVWQFDQGRPRGEVRLEPGRPDAQHVEQVNALACWPGTPMIASAGDDATVRLWGIDPQGRRGTLLGILSVALGETGAKGDPNRPRPTPIVADWVAFTPDGLFDGSLHGEESVSFVVGEEVRRLDQYSEQFSRFGLTDTLRQGLRPRAPKSSPPPPLVIDPPPEPKTQAREIELKLSVADPSIAAGSLRLYQNGVPVLDGEGFRSLDGTGRFAATVRLRSGLNRFHAMASRPGDIDARSPDVEVRSESPEGPGQLHTLALGVSRYARDPLRFADRDAVAIADFFRKAGLATATRAGTTIVLTDADVTEKNVEDAFTTLRRAVKGRPEDTVVVFLAGHTDILKDPSGRERFSLLLASDRTPAGDARPTDRRGDPSGARTTAPSGTDLPFYVLYRNLIHLEALNRLIVVDACQAEAIHDDPGVRLIQQAMERGARRTRTSYLLAARRGEPAREDAVLEHGLLTYVLLRGLRAPGLRPLAIPIPALAETAGADLDGDGVITTRELRDYVDRTLPDLAQQLPELARRSGAGGLTPPAQGLRIQSADESFPLLRLEGDRRARE